MQAISRFQPWEFWLLTGLAGCALLLLVVNLVLYQGNRSLQQEVNERQQSINQGIQLSRLNEQIIRALANLSAQNKDDQLKELLAEHGITFNVSLPSATPAEAGSSNTENKPGSPGATPRGR